MRRYGAAIAMVLTLVAVATGWVPGITPLSVQAAAECTDSAIVQWPVVDGGNGHFYQGVCYEGATWGEAKATAETLGGHLATIASAGENTFAFGLIDDAGFWDFSDDCSLGPWLGGFQPDGSTEPGGSWSWVTAEPFTFTAWAGSEPNNDGGDENSLHFFACDIDGEISDRWNDIFDEPDPNLLGLVVEWVSDPTVVTGCDGFAITISGTEGKDKISGTPGDDVIAALGGNDTVHGNGGHDRICGGPGNDKLYGDAGDDRLFGGVGKDKLNGGTEDDDLNGGTDPSEGKDNCDGSLHATADTATECEKLKNIP